MRIRFLEFNIVGVDHLNRTPVTKTAEWSPDPGPDLALSAVLTNMLQAIRTRIHPCSTFLRSTYPSARSYRLPSPSLIIIKSGSKSLGPFRPVPATDPIHNCRVGMTLNHRRPHSTSEKHKERESTVHKNGRTDGNDHTHDHTHSHSFPFFGHSHSHQEGHARDAEKIIEALKGTGLYCPVYRILTK